MARRDARDESQHRVDNVDDALALGLSGCASGSVVVAEFQEKGRGRVPGRTWLSPIGESLLATVVLRVGELAFPFGTSCPFAPGHRLGVRH